MALVTVEVPTARGLIDLPVEVVISRPDRARHQHARVRLGIMFPRLRATRHENGDWDYAPIRHIAERALKARGYAIVPTPDGVSVNWWCPAEYISRGRSAHRWDWGVEAPVERVLA